MIAKRIPVVLSLLLLAAHYLRDMKTPMVALIAVVLILVFVRKPWARISVRVVLFAGSIIWVMTAGVLMLNRQAAGEPWMRMMAILASVALFTFWSAWLMGRPAVVAWHEGASDIDAEAQGAKD